jgi:ribosomal protein L14E/L6E/L27E
VINLKWVSLTDHKVAVARNSRQKTLTAAWNASKILESWNASAWAKKAAAQATKKAETDFDRFTNKLKKQKIAKAVASKVKA